MTSAKCTLLAFFMLWASSAWAESDIQRRCLDEIWPREYKQKGHYPFASYDGDLMCLMDEITEDGAREAVKMIREHGIKRIMIGSGGGDVEAALDIADEILSRGIDVYADNFCFSSCANYIFLAGRKKYTIDQAVVAWHGAPKYSEARFATYNDAAKERAKKTIARHGAFYARIGVDPRLPGEVPCDLLEDNAFLQAAKNVDTKHDVFWTYPQEILERKYHVQGIEEMSTWGNTREMQQSSRLYRKVFIAKGCDY